MGSFETIFAGRCDVRQQPSLCETSCIGACCMAGNVLELKPDEVAYMEGRGTELTPLTKDQYPRGYKSPKGKSTYALAADCANLDPLTRKCTDYENRPEICREFAPDSKDFSPCHNTRTAMRDRVAAGIVDLPMPVVPKFEAMVQDLAQTTTYMDVRESL